MIIFRGELPGWRVIGDRWDFDLTVRDKANSPIDLTGATVTMTINHANAKSGVLADQIAETGRVAISYLPFETALITIPITNPISCTLPYRISVAFDSNNIDTVSDGFLRVTK